MLGIVCAGSPHAGQRSSGVRMIWMPQMRV
jgi:hypothetical protein